MALLPRSCDHYVIKRPKTDFTDFIEMRNEVISQFQKEKCSLGSCVNWPEVSF